MTLEKKFALKMRDDVEVNDLEELRRNFDRKRLIMYFRDGRLVQWLRDRNYEKEAKVIASFDVNAPLLLAKLCLVLRIDGLDTELVMRIGEKRDILWSKTTDSEIICNARITALTQEDLEELLDFGEPKIYLCGEEFTVPSEAENRHYIGVLGTPRINIRAQDQAELDAKHIMFENVMLPWGAPPPVLPSEGDNAFRICRDAAEAGDVGAMEKLADRYYLGEGIPLDPKKAIEWYLKAAENGSEYAMKAVAIFRRDGFV